MVQVFPYYTYRSNSSHNLHAFPVGIVCFWIQIWLSFTVNVIIWLPHSWYNFFPTMYAGDPHSIPVNHIPYTYYCFSLKKIAGIVGNMQTLQIWNPCTLISL